jgi:drug/metabolite transporter (DMT)-like permease
VNRRIFYAHLALFVVNALYGANHILAKGVMPRFISPNVFILLRIAGATIMFWIVKVLFVRAEKIARKDLGLVALCGLFGVTMNQLFFFHGLSLSSAINSGIYMSLNPIIVVILSLFVLKEHITILRVAGVLLGMTATILLTLTGNVGEEDSLLGDLFLFINAFSYAIYLVLAKPLMTHYQPITVITWIFTFGFLYILIFPPTWSAISETHFSAIPFTAWLKVIYVIIGVTFLTYLLTTYGLKYVSPATSSVYIYFQPILVAFFAYFFLALGIADDYTQSITVEKFAYTALIFLAVYLTAKKERSTTK